MRSGPLQGTVVLDLTAALAGPYATLLLAGLGARVIKVENPAGGDMARGNSPYLTSRGIRMRRDDDDDMSISMLIRGRGKKSLGLDLKTPEGREVLLELVAHADVLVENFSAGVTEKLGIDYASIRHLNPRLVYTSITGFGAGEDPQRKAMDAVIQGLSGLMMTAGDEGDPPVRLGIPIADLIVPLFGVIGTLAALGDAERTGEGQRVDVSMLGTLTSLVAAEGLDAIAALGQPTRTGAYLARLAPFGTFEASDGWFTICAPTDPQAARLFQAMGRDDLITSADFGTRDARVANSTRLHALIAGWAAERSLDEALRVLRSRGVAAEPVRTPHDAIRDPLLHRRGEIVPLVHPSLGEVEGVLAPGVPIVLSKGEAAPLEPAPPLGADSDEILAEVLGYPPERIAGLRERGIISAERSRP